MTKSLILGIIILALSGPSHHGQRNGTLDLYLDRADRQTNTESWRIYADMGCEAVLAHWEQGALLTMRGSEFDTARALFEDAIGAQTSERYRVWLVSSFTERAAPKDFRFLRDSIATKNDRLLLQHDAIGKVLRDANGTERTITGRMTANVVPACPRPIRTPA